MAIAREQARGLLTDSEMVLFGESRNPALRSLSARELSRRVERTRKLRDKARDLLQRQRLGSRQRTGNKGGKSGSANERTARKGEVLEDVLQRFEARLQDLERRAESDGSSRTAGTAKKAPGRAQKAASTKKAASAKKGAGAARKTSVAKKTAGASKKTTTVKKASAVGRKSGAAKTAAAKKIAGATKKTAGAAKKTSPAAGRKSTTGRARKSAITPEKALENTMELLQAKQARARKPRGYPGEQGDGVQSDPGYQSGEARSKALELHAGEIRMEPIHGSISTRDRKNQAKRDKT